MINKNLFILNKKNNNISKNIEIIKLKRLTLQNSRNGSPTILYNNVFVHSSYSPEKEAKKFVKIDNPNKTSFVIVIGFGLGYHIKELLDKINPDCKIFIFEPELEFVKCACLYTDLSYLLDDRIYLYLGENYSYNFLADLMNLPLDNINGYKTIILGSLQQLFKEKYNAIKENIKQILKEYFQNQFTSYEFEKIWLKNILKNFPLLKNSQNISDYKYSLREKPALIVSAGPSLKNQLSLLKKWQNKFYTFATDTALGTLLEANIVPDFIISLDCQYHNLLDFFSFRNDLKSILITDISVYPKIPKLFKPENVIFFKSTFGMQDTFSVIKELERISNIKIGEIPSGGSVALSSLEIALYMGCKPIGLLGQDFAYTNQMTHVVDSPVYKIFLNKTNKFNTILTQFNKTIRRRKLIKIDENYTDIILNNYKIWLENFVKEKELEYVFNLTEKGLHIADLQKTNLITFIEQFSLSDKETAFNKNYNPVDLSDFLTFVEGLKNDILKFKVIAEKILENEIRYEDFLSYQNQLISKYSFLSDFFKEEILFYKKKDKSERNKILHINSMICSMNKLLRTLKL